MNRTDRLVPAIDVAGRELNAGVNIAHNTLP
jgi:hypothetical protein